MSGAVAAHAAPTKKKGATVVAPKGTRATAMGAVLGGRVKPRAQRFGEPGLSFFWCASTSIRSFTSSPTIGE